jgi:hypothetical protein
MYALSGIRTHDPSIQAAKTHALDRAATEIDIKFVHTSKMLQSWILNLKAAN